MTNSRTGHNGCSAKFTWSRPTGAVTFDYRASSVENEGRNLPRNPQETPDNEKVYYGLWCSTQYEFKVRAKGNGHDTDGDGIAYTTRWSSFAITLATTGTYTPPTPVPDKVPSFSTTSTSMFFNKDIYESRNLPTATGGDGTITYTLSPSVGNGLSFNVSNHAIAGSADAAAKKVSYTLTAMDSDGDTATTKVDVSVFDLSLLVTSETHATDTDFGASKWSVLQYGTVKIVDSIERNPRFNVRVGFPATAGFKMNSRVCSWPLSSQPLMMLWSDWIFIGGYTQFPIVRCERGSGGTVSVPVEIEVGGEVHRVATLSINMPQSFHHRDNVATYNVQNPWLASSSVPSKFSSYNLLDQSFVVASAKRAGSAWNALPSSLTFTYDTGSDPDFVIKGFINPGTSQCGTFSAIACLVYDGGEYPHFHKNARTGLPRPELRLEFPPQASTDPQPRNWSVDASEVEKEPYKFYFLDWGLMHEFGHGAGLGHSPYQGAPDTIMTSTYIYRLVYENGEWKEKVWRAPTAHDSRALDGIYTGHSVHQ